MIDKLTKAEIVRRPSRRSLGEGGNNFRHGLTAKNFLATPADLEAFQHLDALVEFWNPQCSYEHYLVTKLARAACPPACPPKQQRRWEPWRRRERLQHSMIDLETDLSAVASAKEDVLGSEIDRVFRSLDETGVLIIGDKSLDEHSAAHRNMDRHLARLSRERLRAKEAIQDAQARRANDEKLNFHVEPTGTNSEAAETTEAVPQDQDPLCPAA